VPCNTPENKKMHSLFMATRSPQAAESLHPEVSGFVRGFIQVSGYWIKPLPPKEGETEPTDVQIMLAAHTELGGSVPSSVVNALASTAPWKVLSTIKEIIKRDA
jgi:hypothetical protein